MLTLKKNINKCLNDTTKKLKIRNKQTKIQNKQTNKKEKQEPNQVAGNK